MRHGKNVPVPRVTLCDQPLNKDPEDSVYEIMPGGGGGVGVGVLQQKIEKHTQTKEQKAGKEWVKI